MAKQGYGRTFFDFSKLNVVEWQEENKVLVLATVPLEIELISPGAVQFLEEELGKRGEEIIEVLYESVQREMLLKHVKIRSTF